MAAIAAQTGGSSESLLGETRGENPTVDPSRRGQNYSVSRGYVMPPLGLEPRTDGLKVVRFQHFASVSGSVRCDELCWHTVGNAEFGTKSSGRRRMGIEDRSRIGATVAVRATETASLPH